MEILSVHTIRFHESHAVITSLLLLGILHQNFGLFLTLYIIIKEAPRYNLVFVL